MIQYESIKKALGVDIAVSPEMAESIYRWQRMYRNKQRCQGSEPACGHKQ